MLKKLQTSSIKECSSNELNVLCDELRRVIYETVMECGGHLASNLGAVESTVALFYVFDFPTIRSCSTWDINAMRTSF